MFGIAGFPCLSGNVVLWLSRSFFVLAFLSPTATGGSAHDTLQDGNPGNDWIQGLANGENTPCCGHNDCYPLHTGGLEISSDGVFRVEIRGQWFSVPEPSLLRD